MPVTTDAAAVPVHASFCQVADPSMEADHDEPSLVLPKVFVRRFHTYLREILTLEAPSGQMWKVALQVDRHKGLQITAGWKEIARYLHLQSGDLLVFDLVSNGHLQVFVYEGEDMCEKDIWNKRETCESRMANRSATIGVKECGKKQKFELGEKRKVYQGCINGQKSVTKQKLELASKSEVYQDCIDGKRSVKYEKREEAIPTTMADYKNGDIRKEDQRVSEAKLANGNGMALVPHVTSSLYQAYRSTLSFNNDFTMQKLDRLYQELHKDTQIAFETALSYSSNKPFTILVMIHSNVCHGYKLGIPSSFAKKHMSAGPAQVVLIDGENKAWSVTWLGYANSNNNFSGGWRYFVVDHGLKCGDICILELISTKALPTFKVYIFRVNANDAAMIRNEVPSKLSSVLARNSGVMPK